MNYGCFYSLTISLASRRNADAAQQNVVISF